MKNSDFISYSEQTIPFNGSAIDTILELTQHTLPECKADHYAIYEQPNEWSIGLGEHVSLVGKKDRVTLQSKDGSSSYTNTHLCDAINEAISNIPVRDWRLYGSARYKLSHVFYGLEQQPTADEALLELFVPQYEVRIRENAATLRAISSEHLTALVTAFKSAVDLADNKNHELSTLLTSNLNELQQHQQNEYKANVQKAVDEINAQDYQKVILSRRVPLPDTTDLIESYRYGRQNNTPARSFILSNGKGGLAGFSPETVVEVSSDGWVSTQPLAGTRSLGASDTEEVMLRNELLNDTKEIAEHAVSVKLAQDELTTVCNLDSIIVSEFMAVRRRGSVQHLASRVKGKLKKDKNAWNAFEALFPAVTASGIPKKPAIEAIQRHEPSCRGWYSGCVMVVDNSGHMDAALVLRSIYREGTQYWLQAGAGIVDQSQPSRELEETNEKLSSVMQSIMVKV